MTNSAESASMPSLNRHSSRQVRLVDAFLRPALQGAQSYDRISGYFTSSLFDLINEDFEGAGHVRMVCNSDLRPEDVTTAMAAAKQRREWRQSRPEDRLLAADGEAVRGRLRALYHALKSGRLEVRVLPDAVFGMVHGKAGVVRYPDGQALAFMGSANDTAPGWSGNYELLWEDRSEAGINWTQGEFDTLWTHPLAVPLADVVINNLGHLIDRTTIDLKRWRERMKDDPGGENTMAPLIDAPLYVEENGLWDHQKAFVQQVMLAHGGTFGHARLLLADQVGLGKTLQLGVSAQLIALQDKDPVLIMAPKAVLRQWQDELWTRLRVPTAAWLDRAWVDEGGHRLKSSFADCPRRIGLISSEWLATLSDTHPVFSREYSLVVLDEAHRARRANPNEPHKRPELNRLGQAMMRLVARTRSLLLGTATPVQLHMIEAHDLLDLLAQGAPEVSGGAYAAWNTEAQRGLDLMSGREALPMSLPERWTWLRSPIPPPRDMHGRLDYNAESLRASIGLNDSGYQARPDAYMGLGPADRALVAENFHNWMLNRNPYIRAIVMRTRRQLEREGKLKVIKVDLYGDGPGEAVPVPAEVQRAYQLAEEVCQELKERQGLSGFAKVHLLRRVSSSLEAGLLTAERMLQNAADRGENGSWLDTDDSEDQVEESSASGLHITVQMRSRLQEFVRLLRRYRDGQRDPKLSKLFFLLGQAGSGGWLDRGCIVFSQYLDTARYAAERLTERYPSLPVGLYTNETSSGVYLAGTFTSTRREDLKRRVMDGDIQLLIGTDAASEGLNLQRLSALVNIDLPWNPTRLEQRKGRIQRIGQQADTISIFNMRYEGSVEDRVHQRLSERFQGISDLFGLIPEVLSDLWVEAALENQERLDELMKEVTSDNRHLLHPFERAALDLPDLGGWDRCTQVLHDAEATAWLKTGWISPANS